MIVRDFCIGFVRLFLTLEALLVQPGNCAFSLALSFLEVALDLYCIPITFSALAIKDYFQLSEIPFQPLLSQATP